MENKIELAISEAKKYLSNPRDATHDLNHHKAVWKNCEEIINKERLKVDPNFVKIAAFWHDVVLENESEVSLDNVKENVDYLRKFLPKIGFNEKETRTILEAILHHEFRDNPVNVEGMILQDADKLDVLSKDRWDRTLEAFKSGKMTVEKYTSYAKTGLKWITILESTFHFKYSKQVAHKSINDIFCSQKQIEVFKEIGLQKDLDSSIKSMHSFKTKLIRILINLANLKTNFLIYLRSVFQ